MFQRTIGLIMAAVMTLACTACGQNIHTGGKWILRFAGVTVVPIRNAFFNRR